VTDSERSRRVKQNERLFAAFNEAIQQANSELGVADPTEQYVCECSVQECLQRVTLSADEYLEARSAPLRFFMIAAHRDPAHEQIVRETDRYVLVEKRD